MDNIITLCGLLFPIVLFFVRYVLTAAYESVLTNKTKERKQILIELIHFPNDLLMVAVGYTVPKIIKNLQLFINSMTIDKSTIITNTLLNICFTLLIFIILPFVVAFTKKSEGLYFAQKKKKAAIIDIIVYLVSLSLLIISLIFGV